MFDFGLYTQASDSGPHGPLVLLCYNLSDSTAETCRAIFHCFTAIVNNSDTESLEYLYSHILPSLYNWVVIYCHSEDWQDRARDSVVLQHIATVLRKTVTRLSSKHDRYLR